MNVKMMMFLSLLTDASQDLFSSEWTEGNLYQIQPFVNVLGTFSCWVISIVGFGIVIFSILKNALSGLYVVNPSFWDKVDQVKTQAVQGVGSTVQQYTGGNAFSQKLGGIVVFLLNLIPNVRALTDFDDGAPVDKKQYFTKSLILLVAQVFIGMMIFFGYPSKIANWIGSGGTYVMAAVINNVDPVEVVNKVSDSFVTYSLSTDGSQDALEQNVNSMTLDMVRAIGTRYSDMSKNNVQDIALLIESKLLNALECEGARRVLGANQGYVVNSNATIQSGMPSVSQSYKDVGNGVYMAMATNGTVTYRYWISASSILTSQHTTKLGADDYLVWSISATPRAVSDISTANLIIFGGISNVPNVTGDSFSLTINGITVGDQLNDVKGTMGKVVAVSAINKDTGALERTFNATLQSASVSQMSGAVPLLTFASSDREAISAYLSTCYFKITLVGDWSKTINNGTNGGTTTVRVTEFRLVPGVTQATYALSTWSDVDDRTRTGVDTLTPEVLRQSQMFPGSND